MLQIVFDKFPSYCTTSKYQGHKKHEYRLTLEIEGAFFDETKINREKFERDLRSILDDKEKVHSIQKKLKEVTLPNYPNINSEKLSVDKLK